MTLSLDKGAHRIWALIAAMALITACGTDDGAEVRNIGESSGSATGSASASGSASGSGSASASGIGDGECVPVSPELEEQADETVAITAQDYAFDPSKVEVSAGVITFEVVNEGAEKHELAFLPGGGEVPFVDGAPDEEALEAAGAFELEAFGPDQTCNATYELEPGTYTVFCIVETEDGTTHYELGMRGTVLVES